MNGSGNADGLDELSSLMNSRQYTAKTETSDEAPDGCGVADRKTRCIIITLDGGDQELFTYHGFESAKIKPDGLVLIFRTTKEYPDPDGELKIYQTFWEITVTGKRLGTVTKHLAEMVRYTLFCGGAEADDRPFISSITMRPIEPEHWQG